MGMGLKSDDLVFNKIVSYLHLFFCILLVFHADLQRFMHQSVYSFNIHNSKPPPPPFFSMLPGNLRQRENMSFDFKYGGF